ALVLAQVGFVIEIGEGPAADVFGAAVEGEAVVVLATNFRCTACGVGLLTIVDVDFVAPMILDRIAIEADAKAADRVKGIEEVGAEGISGKRQTGAAEIEAADVAVLRLAGAIGLGVGDAIVGVGVTELQITVGLELEIFVGGLEIEAVLVADDIAVGELAAGL